MKQLLLFICILHAAGSFSQTKVAIADQFTNHVVHVYDDGTSSVHAKRDNQYEKENRYAIQYSLDQDGKILTQKKQEENVLPEAFLDKQKLWISWYIGYKSAEFYVGDFEGKITKTVVKHKAINVQPCFSSQSGDGKIDFYLTDKKAAQGKQKDGLINYLVIRFDPDANTFNVIDYRDIAGIEGKTSFIGVKNGEAHFVNWMKTEKHTYKFQVLAVNAQKNVRTFAARNFTFRHNLDGMFVGGALVGRKGGVWEDFDNLYYTINTITYQNPSAVIKKFNCDYTVVRVSESGKSADVSFKIPVEAASDVVIIHFPVITFPEDDEGSWFYTSDKNGNALAFNTDFSSGKIDPRPVKLPQSLEVYHYREIFPEMYERTKNSLNSPSSFNLCDDGNARLLIKIGGFVVLYKEKVQQ